jgi:FkbM family methyltransferase
LPGLTSLRRYSSIVCWFALGLKPVGDGRESYLRAVVTMNSVVRISLQEAADGWAILPSSLKRPDGTPRFNLNFPKHLVTDPGAVHLVANEAGNGYEPPTRDIVERILRRGDLFVDVGAHWGFFALQAATHPAGEIDVIAFEPDLMNATILSENVARNQLSNVTVICAACGSEFGLASLMTNSTMGHSIRGADLRIDGTGPSKWVSVVTLDGALASLQKHVGQRIILKIDAESFEPHIISGAKSLLRSGRVALIVWECGGDFVKGRGQAAMVQMVAFLSDCGFQHLQSPADANDRRYIRFDAAGGFSGNVFSFAPELNASFQF